MTPPRDDWWAKVRYLSSMSKLSPSVKYRQGNYSAVTKFKQQWAPFYDYDCIRIQDYVLLGQLSCEFCNYDNENFTW